ncbi:hypothetical protein [Mesorhizobium sp. M0276]|uniref:hypothetical protein n=1 Tax=Mesorhizobium sp. M0276 TaxID=2956928 RepID=UPI003335AD34
MPAEQLNPLWVRGGFPDSFLVASDRASQRWRQDFIRTYLERDIPLLGPRISSRNAAPLPLKHLYSISLCC